MKVSCDLPNCSALVNGVRFEQMGKAMVSEEVSDEVGGRFLKIPGYTKHQGSEPNDDGVSDEEIRAAIISLDPDNKEHWTQAGKPEVSALNAIFGSSAVTAADRDRVWSAMKAGE